MTAGYAPAKFVVLGHTGLIGTSLMKLLEECCDGAVIHGLSTRQLDLTQWPEIQNLAKLFDGQTTVIMCAGVKPYVEDSLEAFNKNVVMAYNLAAILRLHPVKRFIFFSSVSVYGENVNHLSINEQTPVNPISYYGIAKYASEGLFNKVTEEVGGMDLVVVRPSLVYGPRDFKQSYGPSGFARSIISQESVTLWGDGSEQRDFIFVEDVAEMTWRLASGEHTGTFNLASGKTHSFMEIVESFQPLYGPGFQIKSKPRTKRMVNQGFSNEKLMAAFVDFSPTGFHDGMSKTFLEVHSTYQQVCVSAAADQQPQA